MAVSNHASYLVHACNKPADRDTFCFASYISNLPAINTISTSYTSVDLEAKFAFSGINMKAKNNCS